MNHKFYPGVRILVLLLVLAGFTFLSACVNAEPAVPQVQKEAISDAESPAAPAVPHVSVAQSANEYVLGIGDKLRIVVFGESELSGEFEVSSTGKVSMPLIGEIPAADLTVIKLQENIVKSLTGGYLRDPRVSIEVLNYRPFFILGEVAKPGSYTYVNGITVINAVALAGGYTYRANKRNIQLKRGGPDAKEGLVNEETPVLPGDVIRVPERFF